MFETIICGLFLGVIAWEVQFYFAKRKARRTKIDWYPKPIINDATYYVDVCKLTTAQLTVYLEDIKPK